MLLKWFASQGSRGWRTLSGNKENIQVLARMLRGQSIQRGGGEVHVRVALASQLYDGSGFFKK
jgi:hypothetical protein